MDLPTLGNVQQYLGRQLTGGDQAALNAQFGYDNARSNYEFQSGGNIYSVTNGNNGTRTVSQTGTVADRMAKKAAADRQAAIQPALTSLEQTKPEITSKYQLARTQLEGSKQPLIDRYQTLLDEIKNRETTATNRQTLATNNEMANRGISNDSGFYQQELTNALNPITLDYGVLNRQTVLDREDALGGIEAAIANLTPAEVADQRAIANAIASIIADTGNRNVDTSLSLYADALSRDFQERQLQEQMRQFGITSALQEQSYKDDKYYKDQMFPIELAMAQTQLEKARKPASGSGSNNAYNLVFSELQKRLGGNVNTPGSFQFDNVLDYNSWLNGQG